MSRTDRLRAMIQRYLEISGVPSVATLWLSELNQQELAHCKKALGTVFRNGQNQWAARVDLEDWARDDLIDQLGDQVLELGKESTEP